MKLMRDLKLAIGLAIVFIVFIVIVAISFFTFNRLNEATASVVHTQDVLLGIKDVANAMVDAETSQRGYVVTGKSVFLELYDESTTRVEQHLSRLNALVADQPEQLARLKLLGLLTKERLAHMEEVQQLRRTQGLAAAAAEVETLEGKNLMDRVRAAMRDMEQFESRLLDERAEAASETTRNARSALYSLMLLTLLMLVLAYIFITRHREILRHSREEIADANARLQSVMDAATQVAIISVDANGLITVFNTGAEKMLGWRAAELVGKETPQKFHVKEEVEEHAAHLSETLGRPVSGFEAFVARAQMGETEERDWTFVRKDGTRLLGSLVVTQVKNSNGELTGYLGIVSNVTEKRKADEELRRLNRELANARDQALEASRLKSAFLANMSHELRTPLNGIIGFSEILLQEPLERLKDHLKPSLEKILRSGRHLLALINDILDLSKIEAGKITLSYETANVCRIVDEVATQVRGLVEKNGNAFTVTCPQDAGDIQIDPVRLKQILYNLLSNAGKFTEDGTVELSVTSRDTDGSEALTFTVTDTGIGMSSEQLSRLFRDFMQADSSTTRKYGGTGLGLAISRRFCQMMGGDIIVRSEVGKGSVFTAILPRQEKRSASVGMSSTRLQALAPAPTVSTETHVYGTEGVALVIDDDPDVLEIISTHLSGIGMEVYTTTSGEEGLRLAHSIRPDIITLDVMMPNLDGWTVLNHLKVDPATEDIPVIIVTMLQDKEMGYSLGAADYLMKPVEGERLLEIVRRYNLPDAQPGHAMVVEDDAPTREVVRHYLQNAGWKVSEAENGRQALELLSNDTPDLVLLDLMMPEMDGFEFVQHMRNDEKWSRIPVIVVTAQDLTPQDRKRLNGSVHRILQKGVHTREQIMEQVQRAAARAQRHRAAKSAMQSEAKPHE